MACFEQQRWLRNHSLVEFQDYHRPLLFQLEFLSLAFIFVLAVSFNFAVIITILREQSLREKQGNWLIINLCVMDLITSFGSMLFSLIDIFNEGYLLCMKVFCTIHGGLAVVGSFGNFAAIIIIAVHRFLGVVAKDKMTLTSKHVALLIAGSWAFTLSLVIPPTVGNATSVYKHGTHHCSPTWSCPYFIACVSVIYALTLPTMAVCYSAIYWKVRSSRRRLMMYKRKVKTDEETSVDKEQNINAGEKGNIAMKPKTLSGYASRDGSSQPDSGVSSTLVGQPSTDDQNLSEQLGVMEASGPCPSSGSYATVHNVKRKMNRHQDVDIRIALAGGLLVVTTAVCWTPYFVVNSCTRAKENSHALSIFAMWIAYTNSALDPVIYSILNKELQRAILNQSRLLWRFFQKNIFRIN